ncbi:glycerol-3-phosphate dehydrogenase/oxidase [Paenibacillus marinisediminis]
MRFSSLKRQEQLKHMSEEQWDLVVIGGGITGAGIALDAALRGLKVALVEKNDFGSGTSSRSTKLVHGGLRYLKQGEVKLVQEVGRERAILYKNAPHLVVPIPMLLPIYKGGTYGYLASSVGLYVYDMLAGVVRKERRKMLNREQALMQEPLLKSDDLKGGGLYFEYRTDDARLTLDLMKTAVQHGAAAVNYAECKQFIYENGKVCGIVVEDVLHGESYSISGKHVVNAAGPWVDQVRKQDGSLKGKRLFLTKGVHLVVPAERLPIKQAAYFDTPDGRMVFVIPRGQITYVGTTDTAYDQSVDEPRTTQEDRDYLLRAVNAMFPSVKLMTEDVKSHWVGLRPLIYEEGKGPSELSRKDEIFISDSQLITIAGGKLTGYRKMAEKVVNLVADLIKKESGFIFPQCITDEITVSGGDIGTASTYADWKVEMLQRGIKQGVKEDVMQHWIDIYGSNALRIAAIYMELPRGDEEMRALRAELTYSIQEEMTATAADFLRLRTGWMYFNPMAARNHRDAVLAIMRDIMGWNEAEFARESKRIDGLFDALMTLPVNDTQMKAADNFKEEMVIA